MDATRDTGYDDARRLLIEIVSAWGEDEHHDVPAALIERARALLAARRRASAREEMHEEATRGDAD
jgi:hypothetical protein